MYSAVPVNNKEADGLMTAVANSFMGMTRFQLRTIINTIP